MLTHTRIQKVQLEEIYILQEILYTIYIILIKIIRVIAPMLKGMDILCMTYSDAMKCGAYLQAVNLLTFPLVPG